MDWKPLFTKWQAWYLLSISIVLVLLQAVFYLRAPPYDIRSVFNATFLIPGVAAMWVWVVAHSLFTKGLRQTLLFLALSTAIPFLAEVGGVNYGYVFGPYDYSDLAGPKVLGVPLLIVMAWEPILYSAYCIADLLVPGTGSESRRGMVTVLTASALASLATVACDSMIEGLAIQAPLWSWEGGGPYLRYLPGAETTTAAYWATLPQAPSVYSSGVPISNFAGWVGVAFMVNILYRTATLREEKASPVPLSMRYSPVLTYLIVFVLVAGLLVILGNPEIAMVGVFTMWPFLGMCAVKWRDAMHLARKPGWG